MVDTKENPEAADAYRIIADAGLTPPPDIIPDGIIHRFASNGDKSDNAGYYCFFDNGGGFFGCWRLGIYQTVNPSGHDIWTDEQRAAFREKMDRAKVEAKSQRKAEQEQTAKKAAAIWEAATPAPADHPYLIKKQIKPHGSRITGKTIINSIEDSTGKIVSLQSIDSTGKKKFLPGGKISDGFTIIGGGDFSNGGFLCEGWATGCSIYEATGKPVIVSFTSHNLLTVAELFKDDPLIIAADNDIGTAKKIGRNPGIDAAKKASDKSELPFIVCPVDSDFNDLHVNQGLEALKEIFKQVNTWESPVPLSEKSPPIMPEDILPGALGEMVSAVSAATETPPELSVGLILPTVATAVHNKFQVQVKPGYCEPLQIWIVAALESGNRKSSVQAKMVKPLIEWEAEKSVEYKSLIDQRTEENKAKEARIGTLRALYAKEEDAAERDRILKEIAEVKESIEPELVSPRVWAQDVTPEHLGTMMHLHHEAIALLSSEGGIFDILAGRYSKGVPNLDLFLQGHAGDSVRVDRGSRESVILNNPSLTMGLSPQPEVIQKIADMPGFRGRGLLARPLYFLPKSFLGYRKLITPEIPDNTIKAYHRLIHQLLDKPIQYDDEGVIIVRKIGLTQAAYNEWFEFAKAVEIQLQDGGGFEFIKDWAGKLPGAAIRLAGLLHAAEKPDRIETAISSETMTRALDLASIFAEHAKIVFDLMGADSDLQGARRVWSWVERNRFDSFTKRDCFEALKGHFRKMGNLNPALDVLQERNHIRIEKIKTGARPTHKCIVNPEILKGWS